jgi:AraC family transcriptional regulator
MSEAVAAVVEEVKRAIARNLRRNIPLRELSRWTRCSPYHLCRAFRQATGQTMTAYRHSLRMLVALERLRHGQTDLTDLALELGYSSHSHFTNVFRRHLGLTPSEFREVERDHARSTATMNREL